MANIYIYSNKPGIYEFYNALPPVRVHVIDSISEPIAGATINVYCIKDWYTEDGDSRLLQTTTSDLGGFADVVGSNTIYSPEDHGCFVEAIKIYAGSLRKVITLTSAELQEAKIVYDLNILEKTIQLS